MKKILSWIGSCIGGMVASVLGDGLFLIPVAAIAGLAGGDKKKMAIQCFVAAILAMLAASIPYFMHYAKQRQKFDYPHRLLTAAYIGLMAGLGIIAVFMIVTAVDTGEGIITGW